MDTENFEKVFKDVKILNEQEGPSRNIFEPKTKAREQVLQLKATLFNLLRELDSAVESKKAKDTAEAESGTKAEAAEQSENNNTEKKDEDADLTRRFLVQEQLCRVWVFHGMNLFETEEGDDIAFATLLESYRIMAACVKRTLYPFSINPPTINQNASHLREILSQDKPLPTLGNNFSSMLLFFEVCNSLGLFLSARMDIKERMDDARKILHVAEKCYEDWQANWVTTLKRCDITDVHVHEKTGEVIFPDGASEELKKQLEFRRQVDDAYTTTIFSLAQAYGYLGDSTQSCKYVHVTMVRQMLSKKEYSRQEWAKNAVMLSGFYNQMGAFGISLHCLQAARKIMPTANPSEETLGAVAWGYGKLYKTVLMLASAKHREGKTTKGSNYDGIMSVRRFLASRPWWHPLPVDGIPPPSDEIVLDHVKVAKYAKKAEKRKKGAATSSSGAATSTESATTTTKHVDPTQVDNDNGKKDNDRTITTIPYNDVSTFAVARQVFALGRAEFEEAAHWYAYEHSCTEHIALQQDISQLYGTLLPFEDVMERRIAIQHRRIELLERFPIDLNINAYLTTVRQIQYDIGELYVEVLDFRRKQRTFNDISSRADRAKELKAKKEGIRVMGPPLSAAHINALCKKAQGYSHDFIVSCWAQGKKHLPEKIEKELLIPIFRVMMRQANLSSKIFHKTAKDEFEGIGQTIQIYQGILDFCKKQNITPASSCANADVFEEISAEMRLADQMIPLLGRKQSEVRAVFQRYGEQS